MKTVTYVCSYMSFFCLFFFLLLFFWKELIWLGLSEPHTSESNGGFFIYSGTLLNGHPLTADTHDITDNSKSPDCLSIHFSLMLKQPLNSGHPATPYNGHFRGPNCTQTIVYDPDLPDNLDLFSEIVHHRCCS